MDISFSIVKGILLLYYRRFYIELFSYAVR
jgi:hypothetical protein